MIEVFDTFAHVPLDEIVEDGDDTLVPGHFGAHHEPVAPRFTASAGGPRPMVVPYTRIEPGDDGRHVLALARALWRAHYLYKAPGVPFTSRYGRAKQQALVKFKVDHGLPGNAMYDRASHTLLAPFYDAYALSLLHTPPADVTPEMKIRLRVLGSLNWLYNHRLQLAYTQRRGWSVTRMPRLPLPGLDCSAGKAWGDYNGGAPEPSGYSGWGYGNTDTQLARYRALDRANPATAGYVHRAELADPIYYRGHVAVIISHDDDGTTRVWSFGHYPIGIYEWDYRKDAVAVCDLLAA